MLRPLLPLEALPRVAVHALARELHGSRTYRRPPGPPPEVVSLPTGPSTPPVTARLTPEGALLVTGAGLAGPALVELVPHPGRLGGGVWWTGRCPRPGCPVRARGGGAQLLYALGGALVCRTCTGRRYASEADGARGAAAALRAARARLAPPPPGERRKRALAKVEEWVQEREVTILRRLLGAAASG